MSDIRDAIIDTLHEDNPMTIRGLFYRLVSQGVIEKTEANYKGIVVRLATEMRLAGSLPFAWIADNTRWRHGSPSWGSPYDWLAESVQTYRADIWRDQSVYVEVWLEKEALAGILLEETDELCVPLMVTRGYPSITYLGNAAAHIRAVGRPTMIYYFGDLDPSGVDIPRVVAKRLRQFAPDVHIGFERVAVTERQVKELGLLTRPTKATDSRARGFDGQSVELDAVPPSILRRWTRERILRHIDPVKMQKIKREESLARETLESIRLPGWGLPPEGGANGR